MSAQLRQRINADLQETERAIGRAWRTLLLVCLSVAILSAANDAVILGNQTVRTPFIGQTQYNLFSVLVPAFIIVLRLYLDIQIAYRARLALVSDRFKIIRSRKLSPLNSWAMFAAEFASVHLAPPMAIIVVGHHISAVYVKPALMLYGIAVALLLWSVARFTFLRGGLVRKILALPAAVAVVGLAGAAVYDPDETQWCKGRFPEDGMSFLTPFLGRAHLARADLSNGLYESANFSCGEMEGVDFSGSSLRDVRFVSANLIDSEFIESDVPNARFEDSFMRRSDFSNVKANFAAFIRSDLEDSTFRNAIMYNTKFSGSIIDGVKFDQSDLEKSDFSTSYMQGTEFNSAQLREIKFNNIKLFDTDFQNADLTGSVFEDVLIGSANFSGAKLTNTTFVNVEFEDAMFDMADLRCADFRQSTFKHVIDLSNVAPGGLQGARFPAESAAREMIVFPATGPPDSGVECPVAR